MLPILVHLYQLAEVYTVILAWIVVPLAFLALFQFMHRFYGMFAVPEEGQPKDVAPATTVVNLTEKEQTNG